MIPVLSVGQEFNDSSSEVKDKSSMIPVLSVGQELNDSSSEAKDKS